VNWPVRQRVAVRPVIGRRKIVDMAQARVTAQKLRGDRRGRPELGPT